MAASMIKNDSLTADESSEEPAVLETLSLGDEENADESLLKHVYDQDMKELLCACPLCDETFSIPGKQEELLKHMLLTHSLVIGDVNLISDLKRYTSYWKQRFKEQPITDFCSTIKTKGGTGEFASRDTYYLLCDALPEDKSYRLFLQKTKLDMVLRQQQIERETKISRMCLFCRFHCAGKRCELLDHMAQDHHFSIGLPDNLVYIDEFLDKIEEKLNSLKCLYCEKTFRDRAILKDHMRKKKHKRINPKSKEYDKFYMINYLEMGKNWEALQYEADKYLDSDDSTESEDVWDGWEEEAGSQAVCLFCDFSSSNADKLSLHMQELHELDLQEIKRTHGLTFYQQIKLINYIRRQVHLCQCLSCLQKFDNKSALLDHMHAARHTSVVPEKSRWDQPQYFFPTYENDNLLCQLEDDDNDDEEENIGSPGACEVPVFSEDAPQIQAANSILAEEEVRKDILK